jgi:hypothetical protein
MSKYTSLGEFSKLTFPDGEWANLKTEATQEDKDYILSKMISYQASTDGKDGKLEMGVAKLALLERWIVGWSFEGLALNKENISGLKSKYRNLILAEIDHLDKQAETFPNS